MAGAVLLTISKDEVERARLESEYKYAVDYQSRMITARQEGEAIGEARGVAIGEARGVELAYRAAIKGGVSGEILEQIAKNSGISSERADKIRSEETR